ncbi:MAG: DUF309 domain-containing protein [Gemmataceae bacterium]|nr:DUF309 domain-containing protein [Gemmataceae bacterium]
MAGTNEYDPRYLAGIILFNRGDFFEAHEAWEAYWLSAEVGEHRRFVQGLIQAAVALHHLETNNERGAKKLFATARNYMDAYPEVWLGLNRVEFWQQMERRFAEAFRGLKDEPDEHELGKHEPGKHEPGKHKPGSVLEIALDPPPPHWPDPSEFLDEEE